MDDVTGSRHLKRQDSQPTDRVLPTTSKAPRGVDKSTYIHGECAVNRVHDSQLRERLHHQIDHTADDDEADENGPWPTSLEGTRRADEETSADRTTTIENTSV